MPKVGAYTVGAGKVYLGGSEADGEVYLGPSQRLAIQYEVERRITMRSQNGVLVKDRVFVMSSSMTATLTTDDISPENYARFFAASDSVPVYEATSDVTETKTVHFGRRYQLGLGLWPHGAKNVLNFVLRQDGFEVPAEGSYTLDARNGVLILDEYPAYLIPDYEITLHYDMAGSTPKVIRPTAEPFRGSLRFEEDNTVGASRMFFFPQVVIFPAEELDLKADTWRSLGMSVEVTSRSEDGLPLFIVDNVALNDYGMPGDTDKSEDFGDLDAINPEFVDDYGEQQ
jgi:hypothetical protein